MELLFIFQNYSSNYTFNLLRHLSQFRKKTVNIILKRVYSDNQIQTSFFKRILKKLILDSCTKMTFSFNNQLYDQADGVSMGSSLGPVLANIILTEFENKLVSDHVQSDIKFSQRYVDDTLLLIKPCDITSVLSKFSSFDKNLKFTVDNFSDGTVHFLDLKITDYGIDVYRKSTHTGQYTHFSSFEQPFSQNHLDQFIVFPCFQNLYQFAFIHTTN